MADKESSKVARKLLTWWHGGEPLKLELRHKSEGTDGGIVDAWDRSRWEKLSPQQIGDELIQVATEDARAFKGVQGYIILCFRDAREEPTGRCVFHVKGTRWEDGIEETEPATDKGYQGQMMRHHENVTRMYLQGIQKVQDQLLENNRELSSMVKEMRSREFDVIEIIQQLQDKKQEREVVLFKEKNNEALRVDFMQMMRRFMPFIGMKALPGSSTFEQMTIETFLETLKQEQIDRIISVLNKNQIGMLMRVLTSKGADKDSLMQMIASLSDEQYGAFMSCFTQDQMGILSDWFSKQMESAQKKEQEQAPLKVPFPGPIKPPTMNGAS